MQLDIRADIREVERYLDNVQRQAVPKAANRALNRTAEQVRTQVVRSISQETNLKQKYLRKKIDIKRSNRTTLQAAVRAYRGAPNLVEFMTAAQLRKGMREGKRYGQGGGRLKKSQTQEVKAKAWGATKVYHGAFVARGKNSGKLLAFARTSSASRPIKALPGPSVRLSFIEQRTRAIMLRIARERFRKNFEADMAYFLSTL